MLPIVIVGDSFSTGTGASTRTMGYPRLLANRLRTKVRVVAAGGSGFTNPGRWGVHYRRRWLVPGRRRLLIVQSSANDRFAEVGELESAMVTFLDAVRGTSPTLITSAIWCGADGLGQLSIVNEASRRASTLTGSSFVAADTWISQDLAHDDGHPNDSGHQVISERLAQAICDMGF